MKSKVEVNAFPTPDVVLSHYTHRGAAGLFMVIFGGTDTEKYIII